MKINFSKLIFVYLLFSIIVFAQGKSNFIKENENNLTRSRILFGYSTVIREKAEPNFKNIFLNINYRTSKFSPFTKPFKVKWAFEVGINGLSVQDKDVDGLVIVPYVKTGPEMNITKNLFIGGSIGIASVLFSYFNVFPYGGINAYYLISLNGNIFLEFETGYHTTFFLKKVPYLIYFSAGIAIK